MKFIWNLLKEVGLKIKTPMKIHEDNQGAIFLANNEIAGQRSKHIDTWYHFTRDLIAKGMVVVVYVNSDDNLADLFTKNLNELLFWKHTNKLIGKIPGPILK